MRGATVCAKLMPKGDELVADFDDMDPASTAVVRL